MTGKLKHGRDENKTGLCRDFEPELTLEEVGILLGISDHTAMLAEKSATKKLRRIFEGLGVASIRGFLSTDDDRLNSTLLGFVENDRPYAEEGGWYRFTSTTSINGGSHQMKDVVIAYALLRLRQGKGLQVPLLYCSPRCTSPTQLGQVEAIAMFGEQAVFRSCRLRKVLKDTKKRAITAVAVVDSVFGTDRQGDFELPIIVAVLVTNPTTD
jgi:hypothetical protein